MLESIWSLALLWIRGHSVPDNFILLGVEVFIWKRIVIFLECISLTPFILDAIGKEHFLRYKLSLQKTLSNLSPRSSAKRIFSLYRSMRRQIVVLRPESNPSCEECGKRHYNPTGGTWIEIDENCEKEFFRKNPIVERKYFDAVNRAHHFIDLALVRMNRNALVPYKPFLYDAVLYFIFLMMNLWMILSIERPISLWQWIAGLIFLPFMMFLTIKVLVMPRNNSLSAWLSVEMSARSLSYFLTFSGYMCVFVLTFIVSQLHLRKWVYIFIFLILSFSYLMQLLLN